jgi:DUF1680 family protein
MTERLQPVPFTNVRIADRFWEPRVRTNREKTLACEYRMCKETGRIDALKVDWKPGMPKQPHIFWDSDVAKWLEAASYSLATHPDRDLEKLVDEVVDLLEKAQLPDGYLNSHYITVEPEKRWTNLRDCHELYCAGHLMEAAAAHFQTTGKRKFLDVMCRYADHIDATFGTQGGKKRGYCGHPEIELALVKLYRATGEKKYLELSRYFVDERGRQPHYYDEEAKARGEDPTRAQRGRAGRYDTYVAHLPVREQKTADGHAVRALYLFSGMADVAAETGDAGLLAACRRLWQNVVQRRMYVIGGVGSTRHGERFTFDYDLPNETAYAETCANIALVFFAHRMLQLDPDGQYADVMERALYNGVLSGVSLDGQRYFYANLLAVQPEVFNSGDDHVAPTRQKWFGCACCPPNIARLLASLGEYVYSRSSDAAFVHLYVQGGAEFDIGGSKVKLEQKTDYPWDGNVKINVEPREKAAFALKLRIPGWCAQWKLAVNGKSCAAAVQKGYASIKREWKSGDEVELELAMPAERVYANPNVRMDCGRVALQRGPLVYCLEGADNGGSLNALALPREAAVKAKFEKGLLGGVVTLEAKALRLSEKGWGGGLYRTQPAEVTKTEIKAVPYCVWDNRKAGEMLVWLREA